MKRTTAIVSWDDVKSGNTDSELNSPDIKAVIQELVNQDNFNGTIVLFCDDHADRSSHNGGTVRRFHSFDSSQSKAVRLHIEYQLP